jgi:hypothetical protein
VVGTPTGFSLSGVAKSDPIWTLVISIVRTPGAEENVKTTVKDSPLFKTAPSFPCVELMPNSCCSSWLPLWKLDIPIPLEIAGFPDNGGFTPVASKPKAKSLVSSPVEVFVRTTVNWFPFNENVAEAELFATEV